ncbi:hypothetical protein [Streptomyces iakyrus]|uniref:hypothetical protein n=1 Tax=Streptomyces iakyrus TaxID=68219 RepID=UPI003410647D
MSNDYAAIVTTLDVAVLLIGTVQFTTHYLRWNDSIAELARARRERMGSLIEERRRGIEPTRDALREMRPRSLWGTARAAWPLFIPGAVWLSVCALLVKLQIDVLVWAGTANAGADPALAESACWTLAVAIIFLLLESYLAILARIRSSRREIEEWYKGRYSEEERSDLAERVANARRTRPSPTPSAD